MFRLEDYLDDWKFDANTLAKRYDFQKHTRNGIVYIHTSPKQLVLYGEVFFAKFIFEKTGKWIHEIILYPIIDCAEMDIRYPSPEYLRVKTEYDEEFLMKNFGDNFISEKNELGYTKYLKFPEYKIGYSAITSGYDANTGGNIFIRFAK